MCHRPSPNLSFDLRSNPIDPGSPELAAKWWDKVAKLDQDDNGTIEVEEFVNKQIQELIQQNQKPRVVNDNLQQSLQKFIADKARQAQQLALQEAPEGEG